MTEKTKKARRPSRERVPVKGSVIGAVEQALSTLSELRDEFREMVDNAPESLQSTERHQTREQTADTLDNFVDEGAPDLPDGVGDLGCEWIENQHPKASRRARCANAIAALESARDVVQEWIDEHKDGESVPETADSDEDDSEIDMSLEEKVSEAEQFVETLEGWIGEAESCEWPGMFS